MEKTGWTSRIDYMKIKNRINVEVMMSTLVVPSPAPSDPDASA